MWFEVSAAFQQVVGTGKVHRHTVAQHNVLGPDSLTIQLSLSRETLLKVTDITDHSQTFSS